MHVQQVKKESILGGSMCKVKQMNLNFDLFWFLPVKDAKLYKDKYNFA